MMKRPPPPPLVFSPDAEPSLSLHEGVVSTLALRGLDAFVVKVCVRRVRGARGDIDLVGVSESAQRETRVRVRATLGAMLGADREEMEAVRVELTPALPQGSVADLPILVAILVAMKRIPDAFGGTAVIGELSLTGEVRAARGVLPMLRQAAALGFARAIVPLANRAEAAGAALPFLVADNAAQVVAFARGRTDALPEGWSVPWSTGGGRGGTRTDFAEIRGHVRARRAAEIAAAGGHSLLFLSTPGCGALAIARRMATILPPLTEPQAVEISSVLSAAGMLLQDEGLARARPFRAPHHTCSMVGMVGGGNPVRPGEVSLSHQGVLFLDELSEFKREVWDRAAYALRQGEAVLVRREERVAFPARPLLVGAINACACGNKGAESRACSCSAERQARWTDRIETVRAGLGFEMMVEAGAVQAAELADKVESSAMIQAWVVEARIRRAARRVRELPLTGSACALLTEASAQSNLQRKGRAAVAHIAQTIADLAGVDRVTEEHLEEAVGLAPCSFSSAEEVSA